MYSRFVVLAVLPFFFQGCRLLGICLDKKACTRDDRFNPNAQGNCGKQLVGKWVDREDLTIEFLENCLFKYSGCEIEGSYSVKSNSKPEDSRKFGDVELKIIKPPPASRPSCVEKAGEKYTCDYEVNKDVTFVLKNCDRDFSAYGAYIRFDKKGKVPIPE